MMQFKIVIVENDEDEQTFMKEGFDATGQFEILALVSNGDALLEWMRQHPASLPDVVLSDLNMPGKNGYDIITELKNDPAYTHIPVIITSTSSTKTFIDKCLALGAAHFLVKPETFIEYVPFVNKLHAVIVEKNLVKRPAL